MALPYPNIDPVALQIPLPGVGSLPIRWYSLGYIGGLALGWWYLTRVLANRRIWGDAASPPLTKVQLDDIVFWVAIGVMAGGRIGYLLFYEPNILFEPWRPIPPALMLWRGGMSFHGGLIGVTIAGLLFARKHKLSPLKVGDLFACAAPIGIFLVRIANFINGELYGRATTSAVGMVFPTDPTGLARHPSQLYEAALEGVVLFVVIRLATHHFSFLKTPGATTGLFLAGYASARIFVENFREPDAHMPDFPLGLTMGMLLSTPMLLLGAFLIWRARFAKNQRATQRA
ncbi:MAG: prolipoprotein diacylglyceryl transferase [Pseudomonadota bacterium]